ncbi:MAG: hypothetical protein JNK87_27910 [Bryobacterales bacterium]|nr:hypothetical protein [Bryobacterales bacterium]
MKLGAEPKKIAMLAGLGLLAAYSIYTNLLSGPDIPESARQSQSAPRPAGAIPSPDSAGAPTPAQQATSERMAQRRQVMSGRQSVGEFRPSLKPARPEDRPDPMKVDPTLRLDLLAKLQNVTLSGGQRSLFDLGTQPPPEAVKTGDVPKIEVGKPKSKGRLDVAMLHPQPKPAEVKPAAAVKPPPPPIPLKFYGYSSARTGGVKRVFFLEGEDIFVVNEGDLIKRRYKVVQIRLNSVVVEDTEHKHQQTLQLEEPPNAG